MPMLWEPRRGDKIWVVVQHPAYHHLNGGAHVVLECTFDRLEPVPKGQRCVSNSCATFNLVCHVPAYNLRTRDFDLRQTVETRLNPASVFVSYAEAVQNAKFWPDGDTAPEPFRGGIEYRRPAAPCLH